MGATFTRINTVVVDPNFAQIGDSYPDPLLSTTYVANLATEQNTTASYGQLFRGMPVWYSRLSVKIVPPPASIGTSSTSGLTTAFLGVLVVDLTAYVLARGTKIAVARKGRVRSYAGGTMLPGDPVKVDISSNFSGFTKWISGTDDAVLKVGYAWPIEDGSTAGTPVITIAQGDTIFVDL